MQDQPTQASLQLYKSQKQSHYFCSLSPMRCKELKASLTRPATRVFLLSATIFNYSHILGEPFVWWFFCLFCFNGLILFFFSACIVHFLFNETGRVSPFSLILVSPFTSLELSTGDLALRMPQGHLSPS